MQQIITLNQILQPEFSVMGDIMVLPLQQYFYVVDNSIVLLE